MRVNGALDAPRFVCSLDWESHVYTPNLPSVTRIIGEVVGDGTSRVPSDALEAGRIRGSYVHACARLWALDDLDVNGVPPEYMGYVQAMMKAYVELGLRPLLVEESLMDPRYRYAGTLDYFGWASALVKYPTMALIDWKTGDASNADMQVAALAHLVRENFAVGPIETFIVHLRENGTYHKEEVAEAQAWEDFAAARRLYARKERANRT